jgi:hypothetical protein
MRLTRVRARGVPRNDAGMNQLEVAYSQYLELRMAAGEVAWYLFEGMKFRLAARTYYTPDFNVMLADGTMEMHETKGFWEDDARVKIKVASELFPFRFVGVQRQGKTGWKFEVFDGAT